MSDNDKLRLEQLKLIYDYVKFHMGLYLATPPLVVLLAQAVGVNMDLYRYFVLAMVATYLLSGVHAGLYMGAHINSRWDDPNFPTQWESKSYSLRRRVLHHWFYWIGLIWGLVGIPVAIWWPAA